MSNVKAAMEYAANLYRDAMNGRLNGDTSDTAEILNESFAKAFEAYKSDREEWVGLTDDEVYKIAFSLEGENWRKIADAIEAKIKEKNT